MNSAALLVEPMLGFSARAIEPGYEFFSLGELERSRVRSRRP